MVDMVATLLIHMGMGMGHRSMQLGEHRRRPRHPEERAMGCRRPRLRLVRALFSSLCCAVGQPRQAASYSVLKLIDF
jgi:hypothetical protein